MVAAGRHHQETVDPSGAQVEQQVLLVTKGDPEEQRVKIDMSGLAGHFRETVIVAHKTPDTYRELVAHHRFPTRIEAYGMVVTEALAVGLPVIATAVGGVPEALGYTADGAPGVLVPANDAGRLGEALGAWLSNEGLRAQLRRAAHLRRTTLGSWDATVRHLAVALASAGGGPGQAGAQCAAPAAGRPARP